MKRTQIYIDNAVFSALQKESELEKRTISDIIRESLKNSMEQKINRMLHSAEGAFGIQKNTRKKPGEIIRELRKDRNI